MEGSCKQGGKESGSTLSSSIDWRSAVYSSVSATVALDQQGFLGIQVCANFLTGKDPRLSFIQIGQCLERLSPLSTTPQPVRRGRRRGERIK